MPIVTIDFGAPFKWEGDPRDEVAVHHDRILKDLEEHAGQATWFATLHARGLAVVADRKDMLKQVEADCYLRARGPAEAKKPTEAEINAKVLVDPLYVETKTALLAAEASLAFAGAMVEAFRQRRDMLVQIAAHVRATEIPPRA